ncbi:MAG: DUF134 domain-containing protein [bacterium]|nr:DUF134 domain-containing protein [Candidatus Margulisiibacteriota bacterium]
MSPRPRRRRFCQPFDGVSFYKPAGVPMAGLEIADLGEDELEAMRLCDLEDLDQEAAAKRMKISRGTIQRLLYSGRKKIIDAFVTFKAIKVSGGEHILPPPVAQGPRWGAKMRNRFRGG